MSFLISNSDFNNSLILNQEQQYVYNKHNDFFKNSWFEHELCKTLNPGPSGFSAEDCLFFTHSFVYVITETVAEYRHAYYSEKTWKSIITKTPFMLVSPKHSLKNLKKLGFRTFDMFWDESYDDLDNTADRCDVIVKNLKQLYGLSILSKEYLDIMYQNMLPILEHNFSVLENLQDNQLDKIINQLES